MNTKPSLSLMIAVYNKPDNLRLITAALNHQTFKDFEAIVAEDGTSPEIAEVVKEAAQKYSYPIKHLCQKDWGWRKNIILNKAICASEADYLVFIDGDTIPHHCFLEDHFSEREEGKILCGRRVEMSERWSKSLTLDSINSGHYEHIGLLRVWENITHRTRHIGEGVHLKSSLLRHILHHQQRGLIGSNFSLYKKDIKSINGFDELYDGPGLGEDSDIEFRLKLIGVVCKPLRHKGIQFHIYHPKTFGSKVCLERFEKVKQRNNPWCEYGLEGSGRDLITNPV